MAKLRSSSSVDREANALSANLAEWLGNLKVQDLFQTCLTCRHLHSSGAGCQLFPGHPVPAHVVLAGCDKYKDVAPRPTLSDDIPF